MPEEKTKTYELLCRNKFLTTDCKNISGMIDVLQSHVNFLKELKEAGLDVEHGMEDDYATFVTHNEDIAKKFDFYEVEDDEYDDYEEDDEEDEEDEKDLDPNPNIDLSETKPEDK